MCRVIPGLLTALAVVVLPQIVAAQEAKRPERPGPEALFKRLDANHDGVVTAAEVPQRAPEGLKRALIRADKNKDKRLTAAEWKQAVEARRKAVGARPAPPRRPGSAHADRPHHRPGPPSTHRPHHRPVAHHAGPAMKLPDPKELFIRMDKNRDKQLSFEEFSEGVKRFRAARAAHMRGVHRPGGPPRPPCARRPGPPHSAIAQRMAMIGRQMFQKADANKDGKITLAEVPEARREGFKKLLEKADKDGDKALSVEEAKAAAKVIGQKIRAHMAEKVGEVGKKIFTKLDANKDGKITVDEVPEHRREGFKKLLEKADKDGDKALSGREAKHVAAFIQQRIRGGAARPAARPCPAARPEAKRPPISTKAIEARRAAVKKAIEARKKAMKARKAAEEKKADKK